MRFYSVRFGCLLAFAGFVSFTWIKSIPNHGVSTVQLDLQTLYERLSVAEQLGGEVRKDLSSMLEELKNISKAVNNTHHTTNTTTTTNNNNNNISTILSETRMRADNTSDGQSILQPNIYLYLPHLRQHPESLVPNIKLGQGRRGVSVVMGIPTVKREKQSYLVSTLSSLLYSLTPSQKRDILIIVFVAETDSKYVSSIAEIIANNFPTEVLSGLLEVVSPSQYYYPDFSVLKETFGDSMDRVKWRTKQNLDFSFLMLYAQDKGTYYVQLEDDIIAKGDYLRNMMTYTNEEASKEWLYLEFSQLGFIGKMFRTSDLPMISEFFLMFQRDKPIDWLLDHILWVKVCNPERDVKDCSERKASLRRRYKPSLFQHVGLHSSLSGKLQNLKDKDFGSQTLFKAHSNPPAALSSSLKAYQGHSLERMYKGEDFFWASSPVKHDYILFNFSQPIHISRYLFRSGNIQHSGDKFFNTTVEVLPSNASALVEAVNGSTSSFQQSEKGFAVIGEFENGVADGEIEEALQPISALRLVVHSDAVVWALLSEILIKV
ncbi:alpha-1,3-mannosyl-glycoprotein 4-beta-N-acetylglucosaminyltransferase B-like isoform X1 [Labrus mixtus]|uniref:alpha-1,3-mannosyl-glycoprotein 4-beta-N-acetylglucosaminyltransferase B-like isoform X1 n=1 Tax=Labrus mixtus TaxID=508554 RepID=UPI0029C0CB7E|nr:alpha-1,3-mannosyl-glycoprotein 4-beta-N-acetylglucosaminyltransferase B-like isoform X1 [Labrus mixtus]XP_060904808.1 alpha-1,3-mannosyl-glycoprotein 4-beta-N-acetylglucosaminyltransferase B-like isoform X1 [Labrus mixtus]